LIVVEVVPPVEGITITVDDDGPADFPTIQEAVDAANPGDTVFVFNGTYYENVVVNTTINLEGEDMNNTVINGGGTGDVLLITSNWVNITGFNITGGGSNSDEAGIKLQNVTNCIVFGNKLIMNAQDGIHLNSSSNNDINDNKISNSITGIDLDSSSYNTITNNNVTNNDVNGIYFWTSSYNEITNNDIISNNYGIYIILSSNNNLITGNSIFSNNVGIYLISSLNITVTFNTFTNDGVIISGDEVPEFNSHTIPQNNIVNGKPLYYYKDLNGFDIDGIPVGQVILANCENVNVKNLQINNTDVGIQLGFAKNIDISNNNISSNDKNGIHIYSSESNIINNNISLTKWSGIELWESSNNNVIDNNIFSNTWNGMLLSNCSNNEIINNNISSNMMNGIQFHESSNGNRITGNNIYSNFPRGVFFDTSSNNIITYNNISSNFERGIYLYSSSDNNEIINNTITSNSEMGIFLGSSSNNKIYHNNIINNFNQAYDDQNDNYWDNGYPEGGNYWSDYFGVDDNNGPNQDIPGPDGIGDTRYDIDLDSWDNYPLMTPYSIQYPKNYLILNEGWNLISIPFIQDDQILIKVLENIDEDYDAVQWYNIADTNDHWKHYKVGKPFGNDLSHLNETMGFWIHITNPGDTIFFYNGNPPLMNQTITLHQGWNLVGFPTLTNHNRTVGLHNLEFGIDVDAIQWYDTTSKTWHFMDIDDQFIPGRGYWIHSKVETTWEVPH
jgi:parallel beta-helix repeat protein